MTARRRARAGTRTAALPATSGPVAAPSNPGRARTGQRARRRSWNRRHLLAYAAVILVGIAALVLFVRSGPSGPAPVSATDFRIVAYQGDAVLGGHESVLSHVTSQGKPVVLNFFAGQCPPCRAEMPAFQRVADEYGNRAIFVGVDIGPYVQLGTHEDARALLSDLKMSYPAAYAVDSSPLTIYGVQGMPTTVIFDSGGKVVDTHSGIFTEAQLRAKLVPLVGR